MVDIYMYCICIISMNDFLCIGCVSEPNLDRRDLRALLCSRSSSDSTDDFPRLQSQNEIT